MKNSNSFLTVFYSLIRWIARITGLLGVLLVGIFAGSEGLGGHQAGSSDIPAVMIIASVLMMGGLLAGWKWEFWGGLVSLTGFFMVAENNSRVRDLPLMFILFMTPALLFIVCGMVRRFWLQTETKPDPE